MIVIYTPADGEPEQYDANSLVTSEATILQRTIDAKWGDILQGLHDEDLEAMRGVIWILKKRRQPTLRFGDFDPGVREMVTRWDRAEVTAYVEAAFELADADPEVSREAVANSLREIPTAAADPEHAEALIAKMLRDPKDQDPPQAGEATEPERERDSESSSPTPTSSEPDASTSPSSPTS